MAANGWQWATRRRKKIPHHSATSTCANVNLDLQASSTGQHCVENRTGKMQKNRMSGQKKPNSEEFNETTNYKQPDGALCAVGVSSGSQDTAFFSITQVATLKTGKWQWSFFSLPPSTCLLSLSSLFSRSTLFPLLAEWSVSLILLPNFLINFCASQTTGPCASSQLSAKGWLVEAGKALAFAVLSSR